jgi:hypothetical protein
MEPILSPETSMNYLTIWHHILEYCNGFVQRVARQHLCKHGPTRKNRWGCVFYVVSAEQRWNNEVMQPVSKQRLGKHTSAFSVTSSTVETVFSVVSVRSAYKGSECSDRVSSGAVTSQSWAGGVSPEEFLLPRFQSDWRRNSKKTS